MPCDNDRPTFKICRCCCKWRCKCLVPREKKPHPPFNFAQKLNVLTGLHPKFHTNASESPAVGIYDPVLPKSKIDAIDWDRELETAEFSATMGGRVTKSIAFQRDLMKRGRGPGTHEIPQWPDNSSEEERCKSIKRDVGFGTVPLFEPAWPSTVPGPGYTRKCPYYYIDKRRREGSSCVPTFLYDGGQARFRRVSKSWNMPCNLYDAKDPNCLEAVVKKSTGKRGPYDVFTGPRDDTTIKGYFAKLKSTSGGWPTSLPSELDKLLHKSNHFKGRWTTCPRFPKNPGLRLMLRDLALCYKDPKQPGPGHYNPKPLRKPTSTKNYPFNLNVEFVRPSPSTEIRPGPGRYKIKDTWTTPGHGWTCVFKSKTPRTKFITIVKYNAF